MDVETLKRAVMTGSVMASFTVERFGTENLQEVTDLRIRERIRAFSDMIRVDAL